MSSMSDTIDFGIDLGTTNSSIARCHGGEITVLRNADGSTTTPSVVHIAASGRMLAGQKAYDAWVQDPENTQAEFKRWMGFKDELVFPASGRKMTAELLSAEVLKSLLADVQSAGHDRLSAAVITVPAAFGSLQCDATGKAAKLAGLDDCPLLQEPIAAAIAYGAMPGSENQRWMVFDLGGGTLDIAIVSTRNGRLAILDHQGDNRLGGKDIDKLLSETLLLPPLAATFHLPKAADRPAEYRRLIRGLTRAAERAKIALSQQEEAVVELFDLGQDLDGRAIELSLTLKRGEMETNIQPIIERCVTLAQRALRGARLSGKDLDRILLVGGPTRMPCVRAALESNVGAKLDDSQDPMTVVASGAALYASMLPRTALALRPASAAPVGTVTIDLSYERASGTPMSPVVGVVPAESPVHEVRIDSEGNQWSSGWMPLKGGCFQVDVMLSGRGPVTRFSVSARTGSGEPVKVTPDHFAVAFMLPMSAPPLPHTLAVELSSRDGEMAFDPVFRRGTPLPAEARRTYRADQTLRPSDPRTSLPIKFWEIEISDDTRERWWAGAVQIRADRVRRPVPEGSEIELTIRIDASRKLSVEAFIPLLNQGFTEEVYLPDPPRARSQLQQQLDLCFERVQRLQSDVYEADRDDLVERARQVQLSLESIAEQAAEDERRQVDPDAALEPVESLRRIRIRLSQLEEQLEASGPVSFARQLRGEARWTDQVAQHCGSPADAAEMQRLREKLEKYIEQDDQRGMRWAQGQMRNLRGVLLENQAWFWLNVLRYLREPGRHFANRKEADIWIARAEQAEQQQNLAALRDAVCRLWEMQTPDQVELSKQQAMQSGLRGG